MKHFGFYAALLALAIIASPAAAQQATIFQPASGGSSGTVTNIATGAGLTGGPITTTGTLSLTELIRAATGTTDTILSTDAALLVTYSNASAIAVTLPQATGSFAAGFAFSVQNKGAGTVTITPTTSTINGASTLAVAQNQGCDIVSDGTNWQVSACTAVGGSASGVSSITGTANQITASASTGAVTLSIPSVLAIPGTITVATNAAASTPAWSMTGTTFSGTGTTSTPLAYINAGTAPTTWSTSGTEFGVNAASGFAGNFLDFHVNGGASVANLGSGGALALAGNLNAAAVISSTDVTAASSGRFIFSSRGIISSGGAGNIQIGSTTSGTAVAQNLSFQSSAGTNVAGANAQITASLGSGNAAQGNMTFNVGTPTTSGAGYGSLLPALVLTGGTGEIVLGAQLRLKGYTVATLPAAPTTGDLAFVTDQLAACTYVATPVGGGSAVCKVFYNGTGWVDG